MLLLHPVGHTSGQTHTMLSVTCTYAITSISHVHIQVKPVQEAVLSLQYDELHLLKKRSAYVYVYFISGSYVVEDEYQTLLSFRSV